MPFGMSTWYNPSMLRPHCTFTFHRLTAVSPGACRVAVFALVLAAGCVTAKPGSDSTANPDTTATDAGDRADSGSNAEPMSDASTTSTDANSDDTCSEDPNDDCDHTDPPPASPVTDSTDPGSLDPGPSDAGTDDTTAQTPINCDEDSMDVDEQCDPTPSSTSDGASDTDPPAPAPLGCGDGALDQDEVCDDINQRDDDGCAANCLKVEPGFSCPVAGSPCIPIAQCGDAVVAPSEQCDDGANVNGDGCSDRCIIENGMTCSGAPSVCTQATCGDGITEGSEDCDDGNALPFDGCSGSCQRESNCTIGSGCVSTCGDGIVLGEQCDDGNLRDGDGCSSLCAVEPRAVCEEVVTPCEMLGGDCVLRLPVIYRDHSEAHPDFGPIAGQCSRTVDETGEEVAAHALTTGLVQPEVDADGRPQLLGEFGTQHCEVGANEESYTGISQFYDWFRNSNSVVVAPRTLVLFSDGEGGYVNRFTQDGEQFLGYENEMGAGDGNITCSWCLDGDCQDRCTATEVMFDGTPVFFPLDDVTGPTADLGPAKVPAEYGYTTWPWEADLFPGADDHNFYFTSEIQFSFEFDDATNATIEVVADDDVWVYVNGILAIDLGGLHVPERGAVDIHALSASKFGLVPGNVYGVSLFHAERGLDSSSFRLKLWGFESTQSSCSTTCGDGILDASEECDDGNNDGGYGECQADCTLDEFCGDGIVNGPELCDPGLSGTDQCPGCRVLATP